MALTSLLKFVGLVCVVNAVLAAAIAKNFEQKRLRKGGKWHVPNFFNLFSQAESTYDEEADFGKQSNQYVDGWEPGHKNPYEGNFVDPAFFHESPGGGPGVAWQTHYPSAGGALPWSRKAGGSWKPNYETNPLNSRVTPQGNWWDETVGTGAINAGWFDMSIDHYDKYGRSRYPASSARRFTGWMERAVNTTLRCTEPGCKATAALQAFDGSSEQARSCKLTVYVKPTDYEQKYSTEAVEYISVNGNNVSWECRPMLSGCNATAPLPYYPCVEDLSLDKLVTSRGTLQLEAKISETVDECPYEGSLLYAVPIVTCLVAEQVPAPYHKHNNPRVPETNLTFGQGTSTFNQETMQLVAQAPLKCPTRGCSASVLLALNSTSMTFSSCSLTVKINVTDFDNLEWSNQPAELLEFIRVEGNSVATELNPGKNPCRQPAPGAKPLPGTIERTVVDKADVTEDASDGVLLVEAKISKMVDECGVNGNLLDGIVNVTCDVASID